jgi:dienelactone hydrolase
VVVLAEGTAEVVARHGMRLVADVPLDVAAQVLWSHGLITSSGARKRRHACPMVGLLADPVSTGIEWW